MHAVKFLYLKFGKIIILLCSSSRRKRKGEKLLIIICFHSFIPKKPQSKSLISQAHDPNSSPISCLQIALVDLEIN